MKADLPVLEQPLTSPGEPRLLPASSVCIKLCAPMLRPDAVRLVQARTGWSDEALVAVLSGRAFAEKETARIVTAEHTDIWEHPSSAPDGGGDFLCGPQRVGAWLGAGPLTIQRIVLPDKKLRALAVPPAGPLDDESDAEDVFEGFWRQCRTHGWTAASSSFPPLSGVRLATDGVLFWRLFDVMTFGVRAMLSSVGLADPPLDGPPGRYSEFLTWPAELTAVGQLVEMARERALSPEQRRVLAAATAILAP